VGLFFTRLYNSQAFGAQLQTPAIFKSECKAVISSILFKNYSINLYARLTGNNHGPRDMDIFKDRRNSRTRRQQQLSMPAKLNRRDSFDRRRSFNPNPWWLQVNYATDLQEVDNLTGTEQSSPAKKTS
jgi:hypothetical protein